MAIPSSWRFGAIALSAIMATAIFGLSSDRTLGAPPSIPAGRTYQMHRPGLAVTLVARGTRLVDVNIAVLKRCTKHGSYVGGLAYRTPGIRIQANGKFRWNRSEVLDEESLTGRVGPQVVAGTYLSWYEVEQQPTEKELQEAREHGAATESPFERCGTLEPRGRRVRFVARLVR